MKEGGKMKVLTKSVTPNGTKIQIEDWKADYPNVFKVLTIAAYPKAEKTSQSGWIQGGKEFRVDINRFAHDHETLQAFTSLQDGTKQVKDFSDQFWNPEHARLL